jgi:hypothetical protein
MWTQDDIGFRDIADLSEKFFLISAYEELLCFNFMISYKNVAYLKTHDKKYLHWYQYRNFYRDEINNVSLWLQVLRGNVAT